MSGRPEPDDSDRTGVPSKRDPPMPATPPRATDPGATEQDIRRLSRRSFLRGGFAMVAGYAGWHWLITRRLDDGVPWPLRQGLRMDEQLSRDLFLPSRQLRAYPTSMAEDLRQNGDEGLSDDFDPSAWKLSVITELPESDEQPAPSTMTDEYGLADIKALPSIDLTVEHKCIEGWSQLVHWTGARFADFIAKFGPTGGSIAAAQLFQHIDELPEYVSLETPDGGYYVGLDMAGALHPQTLLCYAMNGAPLTLEHGAPLRLVVPSRYGVKSLKRIGTLRFTAARPRDYWAEQGYDWYCGF